MWVSLRTWDEGEVKAEPTLEGFLSRAPNGCSVCVAVGHPVGKPPSCGALPLEMSPLHVEALLLPLSQMLPRRGRGAAGGGAQPFWWLWTASHLYCSFSDPITLTWAGEVASSTGNWWLLNITVRDRIVQKCCGHIGTTGGPSGELAREHGWC